MSSLSALATGPWQVHVRTWLVLGRVSNLPTVWSNCLAAWLLGGGGTGMRFMVLLVGASLMYVGGMFLNDFCDAEFDRRHRSERPIPAGRIAAGPVGWAGVGALLVGWLLFAGLGSATGAMGLLLVAAIGVYDSTHKRVPFAPAVMALCRYLLFLAAGSASDGGINGTIVWSGLVLGGYVLGLSTVAQRESTGGPIRWWALIGLAAPLVLSWFVNPGAWLLSSRYLPGWLLAGWVAWSLTHLFRGGAGGAGKTVSALLAGIVWVDLLAVLPWPRPWGMVFVVLFAAARGLQRVVPAT